MRAPELGSQSISMLHILSPAPAASCSLLVAQVVLYLYVEENEHFGVAGIAMRGRRGLESDEEEEEEKVCTANEGWTTYSTHHSRQHAYTRERGMLSRPLAAVAELVGGGGGGVGCGEGGREGDDRHRLQPQACLKLSHVKSICDV